MDLVPEVELSSNELLIDLARIGLGIAFIPDYCLTKMPEDLFLLEMKEELPKRKLALAYNSHVPVSKAAVEFMHLLQPV